MSSYSKSPLAVARVALGVGERAFAGYWHPNSPRLYTRPQLFACLAVKCRLGLDYRGAAALLAEWAELREAIGLRFAPHFTTLQKNARRLLDLPAARALLAATVRRLLGRRRRVGRVAVDSTGLSTSHASSYFVRRRSRSGVAQDVSYRRYGKLGVACCCRSHLVLAARAGRGPSPDVDQLLPLAEDALALARPAVLLADAGYDSESNHAACRERLGVATLVPPLHGRPPKDPAKPPAGRWRRLMKALLGTRAGRRGSGYTQRWQVECVFAMMKQNLGDRLAARSDAAREAEMMLMIVTHNVSILLREVRGYLQGRTSTFTPPVYVARQFAGQPASSGRPPAVVPRPASSTTISAGCSRRPLLRLNFVCRRS